MIGSFADRELERLWAGHRVRRWPIALQQRALRGLRQLEAAGRLDDLRVPPGNRLEALRGDRAGQYSIRVNDQWRLCFRFIGGEARDVKLVDYH